jgi:hypothetical protein
MLPLALPRPLRLPARTSPRSPPPPATTHVPACPPPRPQRLGFAVVELFAVSSDALRRMEAAAADAHSDALAQAAALEARLAAAERARQDAERAAALEWRKLRHEAARLKVELRRGEEARREARAAADAAGMRVLQLEQRVGELSAGAQVGGRAREAGREQGPGLAACRLGNGVAQSPSHRCALQHPNSTHPPTHPRTPAPLYAPQALAAAEARAQGLGQRLAAVEAAYEAERRSWAASAEGCARGGGLARGLDTGAGLCGRLRWRPGHPSIHRLVSALRVCPARSALGAERAARDAELAAVRASLAELQESLAARDRDAARKVGLPGRAQLRRACNARLWQGGVPAAATDSEPTPAPRCCEPQDAARASMAAELAATKSRLTTLQVRVWSWEDRAGTCEAAGTICNTPCHATMPPPVCCCPPSRPSAAARATQRRRARPRQPTRRRLTPASAGSGAARPAPARGARRCRLWTGAREGRRRRGSCGAGWNPHKAAACSRCPPALALCRLSPAAPTSPGGCSRAPARRRRPP